jgi:hypothetical protein
MLATLKELTMITILLTDVPDAEDHGVVKLIKTRVPQQITTLSRIPTGKHKVSKTIGVVDRKTENSNQYNSVQYNVQSSSIQNSI